MIIVLVMRFRAEGMAEGRRAAATAHVQTAAVATATRPLAQRMDGCLGPTMGPTGEGTASVVASEGSIDSSEHGRRWRRLGR